MKKENMNYEELYKVLGQLFYYTAALDGKVQPVEKEKLHELVTDSWRTLERSTDEFGTDQSALIEFSFDFEESESMDKNGLQDFEMFYKQNRAEFSPEIKDKILRTIYAVADAFYSENKKEQDMFNKVKSLFED